MTLVGPYCHPLHVQSYPCSSRLFDGVENARGRRTTHGERTKAEDDSEASDGTNRSGGRCAGPITGGGEYEGWLVRVRVRVRVGADVSGE